MTFFNVQNSLRQRLESHAFLMDYEKKIFFSIPIKFLFAIKIHEKSELRIFCNFGQSGDLQDLLYSCLITKIELLAQFVVNDVDALRLKCSCNSIESACQEFCRSSSIARKLVVAYCSLLSSKNIESISSLNNSL